MSERERAYFHNYYQNIRRPKTLADRAVAAETCQICGDEWANTHAGWNDALFVCGNCNNKLSKWDREKREKATLCQVCHLEPVIGLHESSQLRCCCGCLVWLSEEEAEGSQPWKPSKDSPWNTDERLGHLFEKLGLPFDLPPAQTALCGVKAPVWDIMMDMTMPAALRQWGLCVACLQACPDPVGLAWRDRNYTAYVVPTSQEIAPAVGTS